MTIKIHNITISIHNITKTIHDLHNQIELYADAPDVHRIS